MTKRLLTSGGVDSDPRLKPRLGVCRSSGGVAPVYGQLPSREFTRAYETPCRPGEQRP
jgi:hypothetical protein